MRLHLLFFLISSAFAVKLIEVFDCGPQNSKVTMKVAASTLRQCPIVKDGFNMCCKDHDRCYAVHEIHDNITRKLCDTRFCGCLHDAEDLLNNDVCDLQQNLACNLVLGVGGGIYNGSKAAVVPTKDFDSFQDGKPLRVEMKPLVDACVNAKAMAVHCHNTVYRCEENEKERKRNGTLAQHSHEDCESMMYECLQIIGESNDTEPCPSLARSMAMNVTGTLDVSKYGKATIEIYPVISQRLTKECDFLTDGVDICWREFDSCAAEPVHREQQPEFFNAARRVKIECHQILRACIETVTTEDTKDKCVEARNLAVSRIREHPYEKKCLIESLELYALRLFNFVKDAPTRAIDFFKENVQSAQNCLSEPRECAKDFAKSFTEGAMGAAKWVKNKVKKITAKITGRDND